MDIEPNRKDVFVVISYKLALCCPACKKPFIASAENQAPEQAICPHCKEFIQINYKN